MKSDRELLELAAMAYLPAECLNCKAYMFGFMPNWSPLTDDGDALRLSVRLKLDICFFLGFHEVGAQGDCAKCTVEANEKLGDDHFAATRRAIVRAAAAIGESMQ